MTTATFHAAVVHSLSHEVKCSPQQRAAKILAIDDDCLFLETVLMVLENEGFQVIGAANGQLGLQMAKEQKPDVIVCDIRMPGLNGYEVLSQLRQDPLTQTIPFIFLSGEDRDNDWSQASEIRADYFLPKLSSAQEIIQAVKAQLQ
ncbi:MAG TPA: response regulator [Cyanophyceae cyanobacterium]